MRGSSPQRLSTRSARLRSTALRGNRDEGGRGCRHRVPRGGPVADRYGGWLLAYHAQPTGGLFGAAKALLRRIPGALAISSVFACSAFAAVCGSSLATAASMGRIAIPGMFRAGYAPSFAAGAIAAGGTIGAREALARVWPVLVLIAIVFGGLFSGFFTATEAGAIGAAGAILIAAVLGCLTFGVMRQSLLETMTATTSLLIIGIGAAMFTRFLGITGLSGFLSAQVQSADVSYFQLMLIVVLIYLALGMIMEPFGAMLVTLPVFLPILNAEGISLVWFGVLVVKLLEIGMITPPVGLNIFVIRNVAQEHVTTVQIFRGVAPFFLADLVVTAMIVAWPGLVLALPNRFR